MTSIVLARRRPPRTARERALEQLAVISSLKRLTRIATRPVGAEAAGELGHGLRERKGGRACRAWPGDSRGSRGAPATIGTRSSICEAVALEADQLAGIVGDQTDGLEAEVEQDLRADAVVAQVGREAEPLVRLDRVGAADPAARTP